MFRKNVASQFIHFQGIDASTGGIKSGVTWTVRRCIDGTFAAATGTVTEDGTTGWYKFAMSQADTNGNNIGFNFTGTGAVPQTVNIVTTAADPTDAVRLGLTALPNAAAEAAGGLYTRGSGAGQIAQTTNSTYEVRLADPHSHGGTLGSSTATLALSRLNVTSQTSNTSAITATGNGTGHGVAASSGSGATGDGINATAASTNGRGLAATGTGTGSGFRAVGGSTGYGLEASASGANGMNVSTSNLGSHALNLSPGAGGAGLNGSITGSITGSLSGSVGSVTGNVGGNVVGSVASVTAGVTVTTNNDKTGYSLTAAYDLAKTAAQAGDAMALTSAAQNAAADSLLARNVAGGSSAGRLVKEALYTLRNKVDIAAGTLTVYGVDDTTPAYTAAVTTTAGNPISTIDPA